MAMSGPAYHGNKLLAENERLREALGCARDSIENLEAAMRLPLPPEIHLEGLRGSLAQIRAEIVRALEKEAP